MTLNDFYTIFVSGAFVGIVIMVLSHLLGCILRMFFKIAR